MCCINENGKKIIDKKNIRYLINGFIRPVIRHYKNIYKNNIEEIYLCKFDTNACVEKTSIDLVLKKL